MKANSEVNSIIDAKGRQHEIGHLLIISKHSHSRRFDRCVDFDYYPFNHKDSDAHLMLV